MAKLEKSVTSKEKRLVQLDACRSKKLKYVYPYSEGL